MNTQDLIAEYESNVRNWTVANLKADTDFMAHCRDNEEFRDYVLFNRPDMENREPMPVKFRRPTGIVADGEAKAEKPLTAKLGSLPAETEPPLSKTAQIFKDLLGYKEKQGFL